MQTASAETIVRNNSRALDLAHRGRLVLEPNQFLVATLILCTNHDTTHHRYQTVGLDRPYNIGGYLINPVRIARGVERDAQGRSVHLAVRVRLADRLG